MKKIAALICIFLVSAYAIFSLDLSLSAGAGLNAGFDFNVLNANIQGGEYKQRYSQAALGGLLFFDATYLEADILFYGTSTTFKSNSTVAQNPGTGVAEDWELSGAGLGFGLLFKYPFVIDSAWTIFPIVGFQFDIIVAQNYAKDYSAYKNTNKGDSYGLCTDWSSTSVKAGVGADFSLSNPYFIRMELLYDYKFDSVIDKTYIDATKKLPGVLNVLNTTMGFSIKLAFGFKLGETSINGGSFGGGRSRLPRPGRDDIYYPKSF